MRDCRPLACGVEGSDCRVVVAVGAEARAGETFRLRNRQSISTQKSDVGRATFTQRRR